jgi:hypothetical protein
MSLFQGTKAASVELGNCWDAVHTKLAHHGFVVIGGHAPDVEIGAILRGDISHPSNIHGFA